MIRRALLPFALSVCALAIPVGGLFASEEVQSTPPGIDTLPPVVTRTAVECGAFEYTATELRNIPDPPVTPPLPTHQVDKGIASITMASIPASVNARLVLVTAQNFPKDPSYKTFVFRVEAIDKTKRATAFVSIRDWSEPTQNVTTIEVIIEPSVPTTSDNSVTLTARANNAVTYTVTLRNPTAEQMTINTIELSGSALFSLTSGGGTGITLAPGETRLVVISYTPNLQSEPGDTATLWVRTDCGDLRIPVSGTGTLARLVTEDWSNPVVMVSEKLCKPLGFKITNNGSATATITDIQVTAGAPALTFTSVTPTLPFDVPAGGSVDVTDLCFAPIDTGAFTGAVTLTTNAETGDFVCDVTARGVINSVDPEVVQRLNVRFDASANVIRYESVASAMLFDIRGTIVGSSNIDVRLIYAQNLPNGVYFLVLAENPAISIPVSIVR